MAADPLETSIPDIARWLEEKRDTGQSVILFTGARTGGLFRSKPLYSTVQYFSPRTFTNMSRVAQFGECYRTLHEENFSQSDIDTILIASTQGLEVSEADLALAQLVKAGIFRTIISTNIDDLLTKALLRTGMLPNNDFRVVIPHESFTEDIFQPQLKHSCQLIKIFGDLKLGEYSLIRHNLYLNTHEKLKAFLITLLQNNVLMLGYDPYWDQSIDMALLQDGQELRFINEGQIESSILKVLDKRRGRYLSGGEGNYEHFVRTLHWHLMEAKPSYDYFGKRQQTLSSASINPPFLSPPKLAEQPQVIIHPQIDSKHENPPILSPQEKEQRRRVFIVHSQQDKKHSKQLKTQLARYERENLLDIWDETKIAAGNDPYVEIQKALATTRVAILLVSANFLASGFITENILPTLLKTAETGGAIILPVILNHCVIEDTGLKRFQPVNPVSEPLATKRSDEKQKVWADLVRYINTLMKDS
jgi:TIR domain/SIR2-like domain